jgi:hypothetical protein
MPQQKRLEAGKKKAAEEDAEATKHKRIAEEIKLIEAKKGRIEQLAKEETASLSDELKRLKN